MHDEHVPFSRGEARAAGISDRRLAGREFRRLLFGHYLPAEVTPQPVHTIRAALRTHPAGAVATHFSAARLYGAPVPDHPEEHITVREADDRRRRIGLRCHVLAIEESDVVTLAGLRVSSPCRMFVELARYLSLVELVVLGDWLVQHGHTNVPVLRHYCGRSREQCTPRAIRAAAYVRGGAESPRESRLRLLLALAGLPAPSINSELRLGELVVRLDLAFRRIKLAIEYDGAWHSERGQWESDVARRQRLEAEGWRIIVVTNTQLYRDPGGVLEVVAAALTDRGMPVGPLSDDWRPHFTR